MISRLLPAAALLASLGGAAWAQTDSTTPAAQAPTLPPLAPAPGAATAAPAQAPAPAAAAATPAPTPPAMSKATAAAVEQRIKSLEKQLAISGDQTALWQAFAQSMRDSAAANEALFEQRASAAANMSAADNMRSYAEIARGYADNMDRLATDFANLYASLSDLQRRAADTLFRKQVVATAQQK